MIGKKKTTKVLLIDNEEKTSDKVKSIFDHVGYRTFITSNCHYAVQFVKSENPDIIIIDESQTGMNDSEVCCKIRQNERNHNIPIIVLA